MCNIKFVLPYQTHVLLFIIKDNLLFMLEITSCSDTDIQIQCQRLNIVFILILKV